MTAIFKSVSRRTSLIDQADFDCVTNFDGPSILAKERLVGDAIRRTYAVFFSYRAAMAAHVTNDDKGSGRYRLRTIKPPCTSGGRSGSFSFQGRRRSSCDMAPLSISDSNTRRQESRRMRLRSVPMPRIHWYLALWGRSVQTIKTREAECHAGFERI